MSYQASYRSEEKIMGIKKMIEDIKKKIEECNIDAVRGIADTSAEIMSAVVIYDLDYSIALQLTMRLQDLSLKIVRECNLKKL